MATLKISDLSVGDWVMCNEDKYRVMGITMFHELDLLKSSEGFRTSIDNIEPIPITAEILGKNGFMLQSDILSTYEYTTLLGKMLRTTRVHLDTPQCINVFLHDITIERGFYHREKISVSILKDEVYIHDIQHALRLAGVDKEINL